jgi:septation ring formation regulator EzrA
VTITASAAAFLRHHVLRLLGINDHAAQLLAREKDVTELTNTLNRVVAALNNTSQMTMSVQTRLAAYERHVPQIAKVGKALRDNALRAERKREAEAALAAAPVETARPEMSEEVVGG